MDLIPIIYKKISAFCANGKSTMLRRKSGVAAKLFELPFGLALDNAVQEIKQVNMISLNRVYSIYHKSYKYQFELETVYGSNN